MKAFALTLTILMALPLACLASAQKPNIVIIIGDDCTYNDLSLYGGHNVKTPNIDQLAASGITFNRAYLSIAMCNPCRTELYTGLYPARNGACWNHSAARTGTRSITHYLPKLGYRVGLTGKKHVSGKGGVFEFEDIAGVESKGASLTAKFNDKGMKEFMTRDPSQPFCLVVGLTSPHAPWTVGNPKYFNLKKLKLPPNLADTKETRKDFAAYLAEIEVLDEQVGKTLNAIETTGHSDHTLVIFTSEQGSQFPGNKWTNWNTGVHTGFIVRWPGKVAEGKRTDALIQYCDVLPTLIEAAGGTAKKEAFDGTSFLPVLEGISDKHRDFVYLMHNNTPEGPPYPIRSVSDGTHHYVRNLTPGQLYIEKHLMGESRWDSESRWHNYWASWLANTGPGRSQSGAEELVNRYMLRSAEGLYNNIKDPYNMNNLADDPSYSQLKKNLAAELDAWMTEQGDPGKAIDTVKEWRAAREGEHFKR